MCSFACAGIHFLYQDSCYVYVAPVRRAVVQLQRDMQLRLRRQPSLRVSGGGGALRHGVALVRRAVVELQRDVQLRLFRQPVPRTPSGTPHATPGRVSTQNEAAAAKHAGEMARCP